MNITAKVDYAMRALLELAQRDRATNAETVAESQQIPVRFLFGIFSEMRRAGIITSQRGPDGGYRLARPPCDITPADVIRALDGPLANVRNAGPEETAYTGPARHLQHVWVATRASLRAVLEEVTLADILEERLPDSVLVILDRPDAWEPELTSRDRRTPHPASPV